MCISVANICNAAHSSEKEWHSCHTKSDISQMHSWHLHVFCGCVSKRNDKLIIGMNLNSMQTHVAFKALY